MSARKPKNPGVTSPNPLIRLDILSNQSVNESNVSEGDVAMSPVVESPVASPLEAFADALTPKVAVSYLRVSTRDQARRGGGDDEGFSIPAQREANRRKAASMGAMIIKEFVDRGASARSANRPELQRMLGYLEDHDVDFVIVHKIDRLARNRADDVEIMKSLDASSVRLVSTTESIDQTPSGILLHGIMSSIAEFYSRNLAAEVAKGMSQKVRSGGTVGRVPLGYRNHRTVDAEGREIRTVIVDAERAPLVREAFTLYASGDWTVVSLADHLAERGLTTAPSPRLSSKPITEGHLSKILINPYYKGLTKYQGVHYPGGHEALIDEVSWQRVQDVLATHLNGERTRKHPHFLKSTVYCGQCGERLMVQNSRSKTGDIYPYFYCTGRHAKRTACTQRSVLIYEVEKKIEEHYRRIQLDPTLRAGIEELVRDEFRIAQSRMAGIRADLKREKEKFERQREKLMEAHYAGAIPVDLLGRKQERISRSLREIETRMSATVTEFETIEGNLGLALDLAGDCGAAYEQAPDHIKRMFNQAFFEKIFVIQIDESLADVRVESQLREPFDVLLGEVLRAASLSSNQGRRTTKPADTTANGLPSTNSGTPLQVRGLSNALMVGEGGLEPPHPFEYRNLNPARLPIPPLARNDRVKLAAHPSQ